MATKASELTTFLWEGRDKRGSKLKGQQTATNQNVVRADLRRQGITPITVKRKPKDLFAGVGQRVKPKDIAYFTRQLATMLKSGVPLVTCLEIISGGVSNPKVQQLINKIRSDVEEGASLSEALSKHRAHFDELYVNLVAAGESAGVLDEILEEIATYKEKVESIKGKVKKALYYPVAVIAVALIVMAIMLIYVIPQFEGIFQSYGADLPAFTQLFVSLSRSLQEYGWIYLIVFVGIVVAIIFTKKRSRAFSHWLDRAQLKIPILGEVFRKAAIARFCRTLAVTFRAGVPLVDALKIVGGATGNHIYNRAALDIREDVAVGHSLKLSMEQTNKFPHMVTQMAAIGEEAGELDDMLGKVADVYEEEVNNTVDALSSILEPAIIVFIGVVVGSMVVAMYLPVFKIASVI